MNRRQLLAGIAAVAIAPKELLAQPAPAEAFNAEGIYGSGIVEMMAKHQAELTKAWRDALIYGRGGYLELNDGPYPRIEYVPPFEIVDHFPMSIAEAERKYGPCT